MEMYGFVTSCHFIKGKTPVFSVESKYYRSFVCGIYFIAFNKVYTFAKVCKHRISFEYVNLSMQVVGFFPVLCFLLAFMQNIAFKKNYWFYAVFILYVVFITLIPKCSSNS